MRPDMGKCVLEEPRRGHANKGFKSRNFGRIVDRGDGPEYEGPMRIPNSMNYGQKATFGPKASWDDKSFSDSLGPIEGYLFSKVGQPWDKVYSELRQNLGQGGWPIRHILHAHIDVEEDCWEDDDGHIHYNTSKWHWRNRGSVSWILRPSSDRDSLLRAGRRLAQAGTGLQATPGDKEAAAGGGDQGGTRRLELREDQRALVQGGLGSGDLREVEQLLEAAGYGQHSGFHTQEILQS